MRIWKAKRNPVRRKAKSVDRGNCRRPFLLETSIYHRSALDGRLAENVLRLFEVCLSRLDDQLDWSVILYLLYPPEDRPAFDRWEARLELKQLVSEKFRREVEEHLSSPSRNQILQTWGYDLVLEPTEEPFRVTLNRRKPCPDRKSMFVDIDVFLSETTEDLAAPGRFQAIVRALPIIEDYDEVDASLACEGAISIGRHIDLSQRFARGREQRVFVPKEGLDLLVGSHAGCDLLAPGVKKSVWLKASSAGLTSDCQPATDHTAAWEGRGFRMNLTKTPSGTFFREVLDQKSKTCSFSLGVIARILPRKSGDGPAGYGLDWCDLRSRLGRPVQVSIPLHEGFNLAADDEGQVFLADEAGGLDVKLESTNETLQRGQHRYRWQPDKTKTFFGQLFFEDEVGSEGFNKRWTTIPADQPLVGTIARTARDPSLSALLAAYDEDQLVSAAGDIILDFDGGVVFRLSLAQTAARRSFFLMEGQRWHCYRDQVAVIRPLEREGAHVFVDGSSVFALGRNGSAYRLEGHWSGVYDHLIIQQG